MKDATRKAAREKLVEIAKSTEFETLVNMIIRGELAQEIRKAATKVYPVASIEIRKTEVMEGKKKVEIAA
jgi:ribosomal protein S3AE